MEKIYTEEGVNLGSKVPAEVAESFRAQAKARKQPVKYCLSAAVKLWIQLPPDLQAHLLNDQTEDVTFDAIVSRIIDQKLKEFRAGLSDAQEKGLLEDAKRAEKKLHRKKK